MDAYTESYNSVHPGLLVDQVAMSTKSGLRNQVFSFEDLRVRRSVLAHVSVGEADAGQ